MNREKPRLTLLIAYYMAKAQGLDPHEAFIRTLKKVIKQGTKHDRNMMHSINRARGLQQQLMIEAVVLTHETIRQREQAKTL